MDEQDPPPPPPPPATDAYDDANSERSSRTAASSSARRSAFRSTGAPPTPAPSFSQFRASLATGKKLVTDDSVRESAGFASELQVNTTMSSSAAMGADPLTPRSRRALEKTLSTLESTAAQRSASSARTNATASTATSSNNTSISHGGSFYSAASRADAARLRRDGDKLQPPLHQMSPHRALMHRVDNVMGTHKMSGVTAFPGGAASTLGGTASMASSFTNTSAYSGSASSTPTSAAGAVAVSAAAAASAIGLPHRYRKAGLMVDPGEYTSCGTEILYNSLIRLRLNNHQYLRISAVDAGGSATGGHHDLPPRHPTSAEAASTLSATTSTLGVVRTAGPHGKAVAIDANGDGRNGDDDQVFVLVNASLRTDCGEVHYSDTVALYCVAGSCKGHFLSTDPITQGVTLKKGPVISNNEKWRLVNPSIPAESRSESGGAFGGTSSASNSSAQDPYISSQSASFLWEQQKIIATSDKIMLKMNTADVFLSVPPSVSSSVLPVVLRKENDGIDDVVQVWEITKSNVPFDPEWNREREYLTGEAFVQPASKRRELAGIGSEPNLRPLSTLPPSVQESIMMDELLYAFVGLEGRYVKLEVTETKSEAARSSRSFKFVLNQPGMDPSISSLASRCFRLGEFYLQLSLYVEQFSRYEYGQVNHALCAALKVLLKEYTIVIGQLEHQMKSSGAGQDHHLTMQKMWYQIQPSMRTMEMLSMLVEACRNTLGGGSLLTEIQNMMSSLAGDTKARQVFSFLMERASVPYLKMIERWIYHGDLVDPYDEFMIRRDDQIGKEDVSDNPYSTYWESRYTIRKTQTPRFLTRFEQKILTAGKYLNIFRTCNRQVDCPFAGPIQYSAGEAAYEEMIDRAHGYASQMLLDLFLKENDLVNRLSSIKHYFLMDQGDFFVDFMHVAEEELKLRADKLSLSRLESLLHLSLQTSTCASDPYKDDLVCFLSPHNLISQMEAIHQRAQKGPRDSLTTFASSSIGHPGYKVVDAFTLDYKVKWPLSLVISCGALTKYQMIFRHLFFCKHVEQQLCDAWLNHQTTKELSLRSALGPSFCLRQRMLHFQQNFVYYMMFEVISPRWHDFQRHLASAETVDDILVLHRDFLDICLKECLLTDPDLLRVLTKLMTVCTTFANSIEAFTRPYFMDEETIKAERESERDRRAEKRAREEAEAAVASYQRQTGMLGKKKAGTLKRRQSSHVDMRRARIKELSDDVKRALTERDGDRENPFVRMTRDLENQFDSLLGDFMTQLLRRSLLQSNSHLSNLCTRLDYNGFYTKG